MARTDKEKKEIYDKWKGLINMSQKALDEWAENPARLEASFNRAKAKEEGGIQSGLDSLHRIKRRKSKPFKEWSDADFDNAAQENGFNGRMLGGKIGQPVGSTGMSKWEISLRNWGHDPALSSSPANAKYKTWKKQNKDAIAKSKAKAKKTAGTLSITLPVWENGRITKKKVVSHQPLWEWTGRKFESVDIIPKRVKKLLEKGRIFFTDLSQGVKWLELREKVAKEYIPYGRAKGMKPSDFDPKQIEMGQEVEMEHTNKPPVAREIAMDHLTEIPDYYTHLEQMEKEHASVLRVAYQYLISRSRK